LTLLLDDPNPAIRRGVAGVLRVLAGEATKEIMPLLEAVPKGQFF